MSDEKRYDAMGQKEELESSLEDLLSLAFTKKKETQKKQGLDIALGNNKLSKSASVSGDEVYNTADLNVDSIVAKANSEKSNKVTLKKVAPEEIEAPDLQSEEDTEFLSSSHELSIEDMVANAMNVKKNGKARSIERVATEQDAISDEELEKLLENDEMYKQLVENEEVAKRKKKNKWYQNKFLVAGMCVTGVFLVMVGIVMAVFFNYYGKIKDNTVYVPQPGIQDPASPDDTVDAIDYDKWLKDQLSSIADNTMSNENVTNILIVAEDLRDTTGDSRGNTDVMILCSINKERKTITLSSFMRDIYCDIPGYYTSRLNSAYAKGGPETLMKTLQTNFGVVVDRYVLVNFYSFIDIVDAIGGIEAEVTQAHINAMYAPMNEQNRILGNPHGTDYLYKPGKYTLNGNQALGYARIRHGVGDDFGRTSRQREVIFTALNKAKNLSMMEIKKLVDKILDNNMVKTNLTEGEIASLLLNCFEYMDYSQQQLQIPANGTWKGVKIRGMDVLSVNFLKNAKLLQETIYGNSNINLDNNNGEYTNTYTTTTKPVVTTPPVETSQSVVTTTTPGNTTPVVTTTTPSETTPEVTTTTPSETTPDVTTTTPSETTPNVTTTTPSETTPEDTTTSSETIPEVITTPPHESAT